jgi:hypothetical protein
MSKLSKVVFNILIVSFFGIYSFSLFNHPVYSNTVEELEEQIAEKEKEIEEKESVLESVEARIAEIGNSNYSVSQKINLLTAEITTLEESIEDTEEEIDKKVKGIEEKQDQLAKTKELIDDVSGDLYMESRYKLANFFLNRDSWSNIVETLFIKQSTISMLRREAEKIGGEFSSLAESKAELDKEKEDLDEERAGLDEAYKLLADERAKLQAELSAQVAAKSGLSAEITDLSKKVSQLQAALIAARSAGFISTGGYVGTETGTSIAQAPVGHFGVFSIGAYTHRNGMSQWGAKARNDAGQTYQQILSAYYPGKTIRTGTVVINGKSEAIMSDISIDGYGTKSFEDYYLLGIHEIIPSWNTTDNMDVLKAQVIAARTYAVRRTNNGDYGICTTQSCQVFNPALYTGAWATAVAETKGMVLVDGSGAPVSTEYAAVHGGWVNGGIWDTQSGGGSNWFNDAWERVSGVSWFYKSWYTEGYSSTGTNCGHTPWLSPQEMVDLVNAYLIKNDIGVTGSPDKSRLLPSDYGKCPGRLDYGRADKTPYTSAQLKSFLKSPVNSITAVATALSNGNTTNVSFTTDRGVIDVSGMFFKDIYNQMAPGHMRIQQQSTYGYFNVEKRYY